MAKKPKLPTVRDAKGREWHPQVTLQTLTSFERETGKSLFDERVIKNIQEGRGVRELALLAFLACNHETFPRKLTLEEFLDGFANQTQFTALAAAVATALAKFFNEQK